MTTKFDLSQLTPAHIGELIKDGKDLRRFKNALKPMAESIPDIKAPDEREKRLKIAAEEVVETWNDYKKSLPRFALDALLDVSKLDMPAIASSIVAGAASGVALAAGLGLGIGLVTYSGFRILRKYRENIDNPFQYLSRIEKAGAILSLAPQTQSAAT